MRTFIATVETYKGDHKTVWLHDCADFFDAVEKARASIQELLPTIQPKSKYNNSSDRHHHEREILNREWENEARIKTVHAVKPWMES